MNDNVTQTSMFGTEKIYKILLQLAPPVMFAQLIQALYNIVDSYFVGKYSPQRADCPLRDLSGTAYHHGARGRNRCRRQHADGAAVTDPPVRMSDPDLLCALQDWALLHLDRISRLRDHYRGDRDLSLSAADQTVGRRRGLMLLRRLRALHAVCLFILHLILHPIRHIVRLDRCHDLIDILRRKQIEDLRDVPDIFPVKIKTVTV